MGEIRAAPVWEAAGNLAPVERGGRRDRGAVVASGYGGAYRAVVVDTADPAGQNRINVTVPDVSPEPLWAERCATSSYESPPSVGAEVTVVYDGQDSDRPVWLTATAAQGCSATNGYGVARAVVVDSTDPEAARRLSVTIPDQGGDSLWATPSPAVGGEVPSVGATVWVQFEGGSRDRPVWVGLI
jgi:hypothetical protein